MAHRHTSAPPFGGGVRPSPAQKESATADGPTPPTALISGGALVGVANQATIFGEVQAFFTRKGKDLYCIVPGYRKELRLRNFQPVSGSSVTLLEKNKALKSKQVGKDLVIDLTSIEPGDVTPELFVIKLKAALKD